MQELIKDFIDETIDSLSDLDSDLVKLEQDPGNKELLGNIFRLMHTIKGTCGFIGLSRLEKTAHSAENLLDKFRSGDLNITQNAMTIIFLGIDRVRYLVNEVNENGKEPDGDDSDVISKIENYIANPESDTAEIKHTDVTDATQHAAPDTNKEQSQAVSNEKGTEYLRVHMNVLEDMINMVSELVLTRNQLLQLVRSEEDSTFTGSLQRLNRIVSDLQDSVMKTRMQPVGNTWAKLPRIVRDLCTELGKKITLEMDGEETELDRQVLDLIKDPLTHMIRNACDHGIESPSERTEVGKKENGTIRLSSYHEGGYVIIKIQDDGRGLNVDRIGQKAIEKGLISPEELHTLNDKQILNLIMRPGFSTAETITNVSGRGVGMDVVRANIEKIGGSIDVESKIGKGSIFTIQIPLTLAIISALIVEINAQRYALPQMNIQELVSIDSSSKDLIEYIDNKPVLRLRDRIISLLDPCALFGQGTPTDPMDGTQKLIAVISSGSGSCYYGIIVDRIHDTEEVVIKSVSSVLKSTGIYSGNTILGDGQVIMILDPAAIARRFNIQVDQNNIEHNSIQNRMQNVEKASMLVIKAGEDAYKAIPLALVSRLQMFDHQDITRSGDKIIAKFNEKLIELSFVDPDTQTLAEDKIMALILSDDRSESAMVLVIDHVIDIIEGEMDISTSTTRPGILGSILLDNYTADAIDVAHYLMMCKEN